MGLDMTVDIEGNKEGFYYRLNWSGVSYENKYMGAIVQHILGKTKQVPLRSVQKNKFYLVEGKRYNYQGRLIKTAEVVKGNGIKRINHKNLIKLRVGFCGNIVLSQYKIFEIDKNKSLPSAVSFISLNSWHGSNGEIYSFSKKDNKISLNEVYWENDEEESKEEEILSLDSKDVIEIKEVLSQIITTLEEIESDYKDSPFFDEYVNGNNLTILKMMQEFFEKDDVSYFTINYG